MADCFISKAGSDVNDGLSSGAPKLTLAAGPGVVTVGGSILLNKGDTWAGEQLTMAGGPSPTQTSEAITFGAYGTGANPIVSPQHNATIAVTTVGAYDSGTDRTTITAVGGGFTGTANQSLYFPAEDNATIIKTVNSDTEVLIAGDFSLASTQTCKLYTTSELGINLAARSFITIDGIDFDDCAGLALGNKAETKLKNSACSNFRLANGTHIEINTTDAASEISDVTLTQCVRCVGGIGGSSLQNLSITDCVITDIDGDGFVLHDAVDVTCVRCEAGDVARTRVGSEGHGDAYVVTGSTNCILDNCLMWDYTQGIYVGANAEVSATTGLVIRGARGYVTDGWAGGTMPLIFIDVGKDTGGGSPRSTCDLEIYWCTAGDLGGVQSPVVLKITSPNGTGDITSAKGGNNCFWTDRVGAGAELSDGGASILDWDYSRCGGYTKFTAGGHGANSEDGVANPFTDYTGSSATTFDFTITTDSVCNDTGDPSLATRMTSMPSAPLDPDQTARTKDGGDIGAYEVAAAGSQAVVPATIVMTKITGAGTHTLNAKCRAVQIVAMGNDTATLSVGGDAPLLKDGLALRFRDRNLRGTDLTFGGTISSVSVFEEVDL